MKKSVASLALSASLLGGGAVGAAMFAPTLAGAQDDAPAESTEDGATEDGATEDGATEDGTRREHAGETLAEVLAPLVTDGTLTQAQADTVVETVLDARAEAHADRAERRQERRTDRLDNLAEATGISADVWVEGFQNGDTAAEIAEANGLATDDLIDILVAEANDRLDQAVEDGRIDAEQADERRDNLTERITERVNSNERPGGRRGPGRGFGGGGFGGGSGTADDAPDA